MQQDWIERGPLPRPNQPLWPEVNPYFQDSMEEVLGNEQLRQILNLSESSERKEALISALENLVAQRKSSLGASNELTLRAMSNLACAYSTLDRPGEAEVWREMLAIYDTIPDGSKDSLSIRFNLAMLLCRQGDYVEAEAAMRKVMPELNNTKLGVDSPQYMGAWRTLIECVGHQEGRWDEANEMVEDGFRMVEKMKNGKFYKFREEELEAMKKVQDKLQTYKPESASSSSKL